MRQQSELKPVVWVGSSRKDIRDFPEAVQKGVGRALQQAQQGAKPASAKPLTGFGGASVLEIRDNYDGDTFRAVYTVRFSERLYVLHVFQKKSRHGIQTAKHDLEVIHERLRAAEALHEDWLAEQRKEH
jgi:phage-related protein